MIDSLGMYVPELTSPVAPSGASLGNPNFGSSLSFNGTDQQWRDGSQLMVWEDDFIDASTGSGIGPMGFAVTVNSGQWGLVASESSHPGVKQLSTLTSSSAAPVIFSGTSLVRLGSDKWRVRWDIKTEANLSTSAERYQIIAGFGDATTATPSVDGAWITYRDDLNGGNWLGQVSSNSQVVNASGGASVPVLASTWYRLEVEINAAANLASFYVNGILIGTVTSGIPSGAARLAGISLQLVKSNGGTARTVMVDYCRVTDFFGTAR